MTLHGNRKWYRKGMQKQGGTLDLGSAMKWRGRREKERERERERRQEEELKDFMN